MTIHYRFLTQATPDELRAVVDLYRQAGWWWTEDDHLQVAGAMIAGSHCFAVAEEGNTIVGMGRAISDRVSDAYIQDLTVTPAMQGRGIATGLVTFILERLHRDGIGWIGLVAMGRATELYRRLGFRPMADAHPMLWEATP